MPRVFRPRFRFWLFEVLPPCVAVGAIIIGPYVREGKFAWVPTVYLSLVCFGLVLVPALRTHVATTSEHITGYVGFRAFRLDWSSIVVADLCAGDSSRPYLVLATTQELVQIPLASLNARAIWETVQARVPPETLGEEAYQRLPAYRDLVERNADWIEFAKPWRMRAIRPSIAIFVGIGIIFFSLGAIEIWASSPWLRWLGMSMAVIGSFVIGPMMGVVEIDALTISGVSPIAILRISWDEIERVIISDGGNSLQLHGSPDSKKHKWSLWGPAWWPSKKRPKAITMIEFICRQRGIDLQVEQEWK